MATLIINADDTRCGNCGQGADPLERYHLTVISFNPGVGCGAEFTEVGTESTNRPSLDIVRDMRPDLTFIGTIGYGLDNLLVN